MDAIVTLLLLGAPYLLFIVVDRVLPGRDQPMTLFPPRADVPRPRSVQEPDMPRWVFDVGREPPRADAVRDVGLGSPTGTTRDVRNHNAHPRTVGP